MSRRRSSPAPHSGPSTSTSSCLRRRQPRPLQPDAVLRSRNVTVEVNTVFENLQSLVHAIDPAKLNAVLSAVAESVRGKGDRIGQAITDGNRALLTVNPRMPTDSTRTGSCSGRPPQAYSDAAQDILSTLDSFSTTSMTITKNRRRSTSCCFRRSGSPNRVSTPSAEMSRIWSARSTLWRQPRAAE